MIPQIGTKVYYKEGIETKDDILVIDREAMITKIHTNTCVTLDVFTPNGVYEVKQSYQGNYGGAWNWERNPNN